MRAFRGQCAIGKRASYGMAILAAMWIGDARSARGADEARNVRVQSLFPAFGVEVRVDGAAPRSVILGDALPLDHRGHHLEFVCARDLCEPLDQWIKPGAFDEKLDVALTIRPALLQIEGNLAHRFVIREEPSLGCGCAGVAMVIPLRSGQRVVHVEDVDSGRTITVVLTAGQTLLVSFF